MKKTMILLVGVFFATGVFAQSPIGFGLKAGVNFPKYHYSGDNSSFETNSTVNFHVTGFLDAPLVGEVLSLQPGISLQGKGAELMDNSIGTVKQNTMWIEIPVNLVAKIPVPLVGNFFVGAGPYVGFGISGENKFDSDWGSAEEEFEFDKDGTLKRTDFGVNIIAGYQMSQGFMIHAGYGLGLSDIRGSNNDYFPDNKLTNRVWTVGVGFAL